MHQRYRLLRLLADGRFHSGEALGGTLGVGRSAVWKVVRSLDALGIQVYAVPGRGYRLADPLDLLDQGRILEAMGPAVRRRIGGLDIHPSVDSTNRVLAQRAAQGLPSGFVCIAEHQSAGRGRRGRPWVSPFGANIYLSLLWRFDVPPQSLAGLSLVAGVGVVRALADAGARGVGLKWPNDVLWSGRKLAGILLEMSGEAAGPYDVVVGVGLNVNMPRDAATAIDQPWVDLATVCAGTQNRNLVAGRLLHHLVNVFEDVAERGLASLLAEWKGLDVARGRPVMITTARDTVAGTALGLDEAGALLLRVGGKTRRFHSGEVSLRLARE
jgi:BirA family biotin operon repressor/biotin-[acetyl-CoA-carboxylase] ligase